ncbi:MAG: alkaline phosphatase family protein [bacterium]|nr:alkaline phosphatase family protein [bacterium]
MKQFKKVVFFLVDGASAERMESLLQAGSLPALSRHVLERGAGVRAITSFPSVTGPTFVPFLTGLSPGEGNLPGIRWFDRFQASRFKRFRDYCGFGASIMNPFFKPTSLFLKSKKD